MALHFLTLEGPEKGRTILVQPGKDFMMGRAHDAYYRLHDESVSRYHCELQLDGDHIKVTCNGGDGGTWVNGLKIQEYVLKAEDVLKIGHTRLQLKEGDGKEKPPEPPKRNPLLDLVGTKLSHFEVGKAIGAGELSLVFLAKDMKTNEKVALRVLQPEFAMDDQKFQRFVTGMKTAMTLRHPNIVTTFSAGKAGSCCWMAMERVEGENMMKVIRRVKDTGESNWKTSFRMAVHISRALVYAHQHNIIHRTLHPKNIFLDAATQTYKLGDLLSAKSPKEGAVDLVAQQSQLAGAMPYVSPEHTRDAGAVDARSDLYCLGAVAYGVLTGQAPCDGASFNSQVNSIREKRPDPPTTINPGVPTLFEDMVLKLLAKKPKERYQTAAEALKEMERLAKCSGVKV
ncbi:MAG: protein kinase domain-containing protein [Gemmataceae bacterium]